MPKSIVPSPAAVVAVDRLTLQATDARATDHGAGTVGASGLLDPTLCFSEE
jgi:hypothetical protein